MNPDPPLTGQLRVNLRHLEEHDLSLDEALAPQAMDLDTRDELLRLAGPVRVRAQVQKLEQALLIQGRVTLLLDCECARCLKAFQRELVLDPWTAHLPLAGDDAVPLDGDWADLTPQLREDILLAFPQHPLCIPECEGLLRKLSGQGTTPGNTGGRPSPWADLDKLNLEP